jgi:hypothetical protein
VGGRFWVHVFDRNLANLREACDYGDEPAGSGATELVS